VGACTPGLHDSCILGWCGREAVLSAWGDGGAVALTGLVLYISFVALFFLCWFWFPGWHAFRFPCRHAYVHAVFVCMLGAFEVVFGVGWGDTVAG